MESFATGLRIFQDLAEEPRMEKKAKKEGGFVFPEPKRKKAQKNLTWISSLKKPPSMLNLMSTHSWILFPGPRHNARDA